MGLALGFSLGIARFRAVVAGGANSAPVNVSLPALSGTPNVGQQLSCSQGAWDGSPTPTFAYQWKRGATDIGTNAPTYTLVAGDAGQSITCQVTATNIAGSASATSNAVTGRSTPANTALPTISGTPEVGQTLTAAPGTWTGSPAPSYGYQWLLGVAAIPGATAATYLVPPEDETFEVSVRVTGTNAAGSASATSAPVTIAAAPPPPLEA
jgi:hypothetical protein